MIGTCPHYGAEVLEKQKGWFCSNRECRFILWKDNAYFTKIGKRLTSQIVEKLLKDGRARLKDCKSQKTGKTYNADILLTTEADGRPQFSLEFPDAKEAVVMDEKEHSIRFHSSCRTLFRIPDGETVGFSSRTGSSLHDASIWMTITRWSAIPFFVSVSLLSIWKHKNGSVRPEPEITAEQAAWQLRHREYLALQRTDSGFDYTIYSEGFEQRRRSAGCSGAHHEAGS